MSAKLVQIFQSGQKYSASVDGGARFSVGRKVSYEGMVGITNDGAGTGFKYAFTDYPEVGHWAPFIQPTAVCESSAFMTNVNTYDKARFTFGFFQFAAHVADGDFVRFFHRIIALPSGPEYFPDLLLQNNRIYRETETGLKQLEDANSTTGLMNYLNPSSSSVEDIEVINSAKFIDGTTQDADQRRAQVAEAVNTAQTIMKVSGKRYGLDGLLDKLCLVVMDIRHQGRGGSQAIINALQSGSTEDAKYKNLLQIGAGQFAGRIKTLKDEIQKLVAAGSLGVMRYRVATNDFA